MPLARARTCVLRWGTLIILTTFPRDTSEYEAENGCTDQYVNVSAGEVTRVDARVT